MALQLRDHADAPRRGSALRLVLAAERLFATHGIDGVSLRQIAAEAGSSNNSAVHYHFGSKHGLIAAIFRHRLPQIISERRLLAARCDPDDLRSRFEAHFLPVLTMAEATDNHYVSFVEQIQRMDVAAAGDLLDLPDEGVRSNEEFRRDLHRLLAHLDEPIRQLRIDEGQLLCLHAAADRERAVVSGARRGAVRALRQLARSTAWPGSWPPRPRRRRCGGCAMPATSAPGGSACCDVPRCGRCAPRWRRRACRPTGRRGPPPWRRTWSRARRRCRASRRRGSCSRTGSGRRRRARWHG